MNKKTNYRNFSINIRPKQYNKLLELKKLLLEEHEIHISFAELIRDSIDNFLEQNNKNELENYLEKKGW